MIPSFELPFRDSGRTYAALVYDVDPELLVRDVAVFETKPGGFRYVGCGVFGKRFVRVGDWFAAKWFERTVDGVVRKGMDGT